uniref:Uncharacterized protein n=1 Tax=Cacopsylla melanoneura TaxID=428564 RepID=A0A8D8ZHL1_9HEMI
MTRMKVWTRPELSTVPCSRQNITMDLPKRCSPTPRCPCWKPPLAHRSVSPNQLGLVMNRRLMRRGTCATTTTRLASTTRKLAKQLARFACMRTVSTTCFTRGTRVS